MITMARKKEAPELKIAQPEDLKAVKPPFKRAAEVAALVEFFFDQAQGTITTYRQIKEIINEDPQGPKGHSILYRARQILVREYRIVVDVIPNVGAQRLSDLEIVETSDSGIGKIRRGTERESLKLACANIDILSQEIRTKFFANISLFGALKLATSIGGRRIIEEQAEKAASFINPGRIFKSLSDGK